MFDVLEVEISNFKSYKGKHSFVFPDKPGLYYLKGINEYNPRLGGNGTGKTSLIDSIFWCLYGKSTRGLRAGDIVTWGEKNAVVTLKLAIGDADYIIRRSQSPNSLTINDEPVDQEAVNKLVRLNEQALAYAVIMPQFGDSFFDLSPSAKLTLFSQIMDLDFWLVKSKTAATAAAALERQANSLEKDLANIEGQLKILRTERKGLKQRSADFDTERNQKVDELKGKRDSLAAQIERTDKDNEAADKRHKALGKECEKLSEALVECDEELAGAEQALRTAEAKNRDLRRIISEAKEELKHFETLKGSTCPHCLQPVDDSHVDTHEKQLQKKVDQAAKDLKKALKRYDTVESRVAVVKKDRLALYNLARSKKQEQEKAYADKADANHYLFHLESSLERIETEIKTTKNQANPYDQLVKEINRKVNSLKSQMAEVEEELADTLEEHEAVSYWINGFKRIRLFIIEEAIKGLEIEVNNHLDGLGLVDWSIQFDIERENKSGGITKGFTVSIVSPKHDKPVRWEAWSGGETQRLRIAGDLGLSNLILERVGLVGQIEIHDEPSEHMSKEGVESMLETLYDRAHTHNKKIWLVDHQTYDSGLFSGTLTATMGEDGFSNLEFTS